MPRKSKVRLKLRKTEPKLNLRKIKAENYDMLIKDCQIPGMKALSQSSCIARQEALTGKRNIIRRKVSVYHKGLFMPSWEFLDPIGFCVGCKYWEQDEDPPTAENIPIRNYRSSGT